LRRLAPRDIRIFRETRSCCWAAAGAHRRSQGHPEPGVEPFEAVLDVTEPMGMETLIYFTLEGAQICGRVNPMRGRAMAGRFDWQ